MGTCSEVSQEQRHEHIGHWRWGNGGIDGEITSDGKRLLILIAQCSAKKRGRYEVCQQQVKKSQVRVANDVEAGML